MRSRLEKYDPPGRRWCNAEIRRLPPLVLLLALAAGHSPIAVPAAEPPARERSQDSGDPDMPGWLRRVIRSRAAGIYERSHDSVLAAFHDVVAEARKSTVQVYVDHRQVALGTIVAPDGFVLTKASELVKDGEPRGSIGCRLGGGKLQDAKLVGLTREYDLAMLRLDAQDLPAIQWSESEPVPVGSWLATAGTGEEPLAIGVVSVAPREIPPPAAALGVRLKRSDTGPEITEVVDGSGAAQAGLKVGDIVLTFNGRKVRWEGSLIALISRSRPGDVVKLKVLRQSEELLLDVTLGSSTDSVMGRRANFQDTLGGPLSDRRADFPSALQHDTVLRPADCGGPVVDLTGKAIGINIARSGRVSSYALPAADVLPLIEELKSGRLTTDYLVNQRSEALEKMKQLTEAVETWREKSSATQKFLQESIDAVTQAQAAAESAESADSALLVLQRAQQQKSDAEKAARDAQSALENAIAELKKHEAEAVSLEH